MARILRPIGIQLFVTALSCAQTVSVPEPAGESHHGLTVSPNAPQDDVLTMLAMPGQVLHYSVEIPRAHQPGLFWTECREPSSSRKWNVMPPRLSDYASGCSFCAAAPLRTMRRQPNSGLMSKSHLSHVGVRRSKPAKSFP